jgi:hypothetical protein
MPLLVRVDHEKRVIFVRGEGIVTDGHLLDYVSEYLSDPEVRSYDELFDLTDADLHDVTYKGLASVASAAAATDSGGASIKIAILVSQVLGVGLSRMYQTLREVKGGQRLTRVFQDRADCMEWLGLPS